MKYDEKTGMLELDNSDAPKAACLDATYNLIGDKKIKIVSTFRAEDTTYSGRVNLMNISLNDDNAYMVKIRGDKLNHWHETDNIQIPAPTLPDLLERAKSEPVTYKWDKENGETRFFTVSPGEFYEHYVYMFNAQFDAKMIKNLQTQLAPGVWVPVNDKK